MGIHYNAFISYRHHPEDMKVAEQIQRQLEHYRVPRVIRKQGKRIGRIFRDKEELPITSNLSDDIYEALRNSDYLIVICSTHTRESTWVQREIETFLRFHDYSQVLTVLVNGEPYETIPKILLNRKITDSLTGEVREESVEPLSCDWRVSRRKVRHEEFLRLAAALLHCRYDELRQRERQYRMRRMVACFSAALALSVGMMGYYIYTSIQIQKNLEEAQINQSRYLASAAMQQLEEGDRLLAMELALEALPSCASERPFVAQAEYALGKALGIYTSDSRPQAVGAITCDAVILQFQITDDRKTMFVVDNRDVLSVWNMETYEKMAAVQLPDSVKDLNITKNGNALVLGYDRQISCYDLNAELLWQATGVSSSAMTQDRDILILLCDKQLSFRNPDTGTEAMADVEIQIPQEDEIPVLSLLQERYDLQQPVMVVYKNWSNEKVLGVNIHSGETTVLDTFPEGMTVRYTGSTEDGDLLIGAADKSFLVTGDFGEMVTNTSIQNQLRCYQAKTLQYKWTAELTSFCGNSQYILEMIGDNRILWQTDDAICQVDAASGEVLGNCMLRTTPLWSNVQDNSAEFLLSDGSAGTYSYADNAFNSIRYFKENLDLGFCNNSIYVHQENSTQILVYSDLWDKNWEQVDSAQIGTVSDYQIFGNLALVQHAYGVSLINTQEKSLLWTQEEEISQNKTILDFSENGKNVFVCGQDGKLFQISVATGESNELSLPTDINGNSLSYTGSDGWPQKDGTQFYFTAFDQVKNTCYVVAWNCETLEASAYPLCACENGAGRGVLLCAGDGVVYAWEERTKAIYRLDTNTGETEIIREDIVNQPVVQILDEENTICLCEDNRVILISARGEEMTVDLGDQKGISCYLMQDMLLVITDSGNLLRFSRDTGEKLGEAGLEIYRSFFSNISPDYYHPSRIRWTRIDEKNLFIDIFNAGNIIQTEQWEVVAFVPECVGYLPSENSFLTGLEDFSTIGQQLGLFPHYSTEEIQTMAKKALGDYTLTPEQKCQYGLVKE